MQVLQVIGIVLLVLLLGSPIWTLLIVIWIKRLDILAFIHPDKYVEVTMYELDENKSCWIEKKTDMLQFEFNNLKYNMFHSTPKFDKDGNILNDEKGNPVIEKKSPVYRSGRLGSFTYIEGNIHPLDLRDNKLNYSSETVVDKEIARTDLVRLVSSVGYNEFLGKYGIWIVIGFIVIVAILLFRQPKVVIDASILNASIKP